MAVVASAFLHDLLYPVLATANTEERLEIRDLLITLLDADAAVSESVRSALETALLDVYFYLEDFRGALARIENGISGYDEDWHAELRNKVGAHLAEQEGRIADAVRYYENHIARVRMWSDALISPEDGRKIVPAEVIALNKRRIGDLWMSEGEVEKAKAAHEQALRYYELARDAYGDDEASRAQMDEMLAEMAAVAAGLDE